DCPRGSAARADAVLRARSGRLAQNPERRRSLQVQSGREPRNRPHRVPDRELPLPRDFLRKVRKPGPALYWTRERNFAAELRWRELAVGKSSLPVCDCFAEVAASASAVSEAPCLSSSKLLACL